MITDEQNNQHFLDNIDKLAGYIEQAWDRIMPAGWGNDRCPKMQVIKDAHEPSIRLLGGTIEIVPGVFEAKSILRTNEFPGYTVLTYKHHHATRWEPEDCEDIELATVRGEAQAAQEALKQLWLIESGNYWDGVGDSEYAAELLAEDTAE